MKRTLDLRNYVNEAMRHPYVKGFAIHVHHDGADHVHTDGNLQENRRFFAASVTKLFVTACMLRLLDEKKLSLEDTVVSHLGDILPERFHTYKGHDYTDTLTIRHLMSNTSGLPDYFDKETTKRLLASQDETWGLRPVIDYVKDKDAHFPPGHRKKAKYCDTNYQLLGAIIEKNSGRSFAENVSENITKPLNMKDSYMYDGREDKRLVNIFYKDKEIVLPQYLASIGAEGGLVSTASDLNVFLRAFFAGELFDKAHLPLLYDWRLLFGPGLFFYGVGISMQPINLFKMKKGLIGHWGHSGAFAFHDPRLDVYLSGTVNQFVGHNKAVGVMLKALKALR